MKRRKKGIYYLSVILIILLGAILRIYAARALRIDYDEPGYSQIAIYYAEAIRQGDFETITSGDEIDVHPSFAKLIYALVLVPQSPVSSIPEVPPGAELYPFPDSIQYQSLRLTAVFFGILNVLLVTIVDPLAGFFLAINTYAIKYTSQIYLEALPMFTMTISVLAYLRSERRVNGWLMLSAVALGMTAAGKYLYCVGGIAILVDFLIYLIFPEKIGNQERVPIGRGLLIIIGWGLLSVLTYFIFNPVLWTDTVDAFFYSIFNNIWYSQSDHVQSSGYPAHQPFIWLFSSVPWHPGIIFTRFDGLVSLIAIFGIPLTWRERRVMILWWVVGMIFLLFWSTKWPQYILSVTVPITFCAAAAIRQLISWLWRHRDSRTIQSSA